MFSNLNNVLRYNRNKLSFEEWVLSESHEIYMSVDFQESSRWDISA